MKQLVVLFAFLQLASAQGTHIIAGNIENVLYADQFPGSDIGAQINNAYASCKTGLGCHIKVPAGTYTFTTPILLSKGSIIFGNPGTPAFVECDPGMTIMTYTPLSGTAMTLDYGGANVTPVDSVARPGIHGCVVRGLGGPLGAGGSAIGIADGPNFFAQNVIDGVTVQGFNVGVQFNNSSTFENVLTHSNVGFNNINVFISNGANNTENNRIVFNNLSNGNYCVKFDTAVGGGDWVINNNSIDGCNTAALLVANAGFGSQYLHIMFNENHIEDAGSNLQNDLLQINGGAVDIIGDTFVIDSVTCNTGTCNELVAASTASVNVRDVQVHAAPTFTNFIKLTGAANANIGTVSANNGEFSGGIYTPSAASGAVCIHGNGSPALSCTTGNSTALALSQSSASAAELSAGGGASSLQLASGTGGVSITGSLQITDQGRCTMASGTCSAQALSRTYVAAPQCQATWNGAGTCTGVLSCSSSTTTVTPQSSVGSDSCHMNWFVLGN